ARLMIARGNPVKAIELLQPLLDETEALGFTRRAIGLRILLAQALYQKGDLGDAAAFLSPAIRLAATQNMVRSFIDEGPWLKDLFRLWRDSIPVNDFFSDEIEMLHDYSDMILLAFENDAANLSPKGRNLKNHDPVDQDSLIEPPSARELEILEILAQGFHNKEIADVLSVSSETVKWHLKNLYAKLGVSNRTEAINEARILGIIQ
ncbi:MAG: hypothetical protein JRH15_22825, partial [Deltaproteobacteria bacterium]|nr:hypothetical protein [Deltaproteobacteria bacterium]